MVTEAVVKNIPSVEKWTEMMGTSSPEWAHELWQLAQQCLAFTRPQDPYGWGERIGISQRILRERGIPQV